MCFKKPAWASEHPLFFVDRKALKVVGRIIGLRNAETHNSSTDGHNLTCFCLFGYSKSILVREGFFSSMCLNSCLKREDNLEKIMPLSNVFISFNFGRIWCFFETKMNKMMIWKLNVDYFIVKYLRIYTQLVASNTPKGLQGLDNELKHLSF